MASWRTSARPASYPRARGLAHLLASRQLKQIGLERRGVEPTERGRRDQEAARTREPRQQVRRQREGAFERLRVARETLRDAIRQHAQDGPEAIARLGRQLEHQQQVGGELRRDRTPQAAHRDPALLRAVRKLEALHAGTKIDGEREAAARAAERIRARLAELRGHEVEHELLYRIADRWNRKLFLALCRRYGLKPFREAGRRYSTVKVVAPERFQDEMLWPEFVALSEELEKHL